MVLTCEDQLPELFMRSGT